MAAPIYGKYRGLVVNNVDPMRLCRVLVAMRALGESMAPMWATPCVPLATRNAGILALPAIGSEVWVEFEQGDPRRPIWAGGCWNEQDRPPETGSITPDGSPIILQTADGTHIRIGDTAAGAGGIAIRTATGAELVIDAKGIRISNGLGATIEMAGPTVTINGGALEVS